MANHFSRNVLATEQAAEGDDRVVLLAEALRMVLFDTRAELYAYAAEHSIPHDVVDAAFRRALAGMLSSRVVH